MCVSVIVGDLSPSGFVSNIHWKRDSMTPHVGQNLNSQLARAQCPYVDLQDWSSMITSTTKSGFDPMISTALGLPFVRDAGQ